MDERLYIAKALKVFPSRGGEERGRALEDIFHENIWGVIWQMVE
jgi:hypothetical protein